jgi:2-(1,2-epoxy-1,2-dihydrophenyl)acetyl-CoA isomerase
MDGATAGDEVLERLEDGVLTITLNRPDDMNALNPTLMRRLVEATQRAANDSAVGCVVLTGAGRAFCAGADVKHVVKANAAEVAAKDAAAPAADKPKRPKQTLEQKAAWIRRSEEAARLLHEMSKPAIAMINGSCAGAGLSLAGACDLRFAAESARFATAFGKFGISGDYGGSYFWTRLLGSAKARELYFLGEKFDAARALAWGVVSAVHPDGELEAKVMEVARDLASRASTYGYMKRNLNAAENGRLEELLDMEALNTVLSREATNAARAARS